MGRWAAGPAGQTGRLQRRGFIAGLAALAAATLGRATTTPAEAADGDPLVLGTGNTASGPTTLERTYLAGSTDPPSLHVIGHGSDGVYGEVFDANPEYSPELYGVWGITYAPQFGIGVAASDFSDGPEARGLGAYSKNGRAVWALTDGTGYAVYGEAYQDQDQPPVALGVLGASSGPGVFGWSKIGHAGQFKGSVLVQGSLTVTGAKSAAVPGPDGSLRRLYCLESPESYFEDFGSGRLVNGRAEVQLDPAFAALVRRDSYHVFLSDYGDSNGLYVHEIGPQGFEVRERRGGTGSVRFSYRVVAKRRDIEGPRLEQVAEAANTVAEEIAHGKAQPRRLSRRP